MHGRCLVTSCTRNGENLISVVLGADTKKFRTKDSISIIEYTYATYSRMNLKEKIEKAFEEWKKENKIQIEKGKEESILPQLEEIPYEHYLVKEGEEEKIQIEIECKTNLAAPVEPKVQIGSVKITNQGEEILKLKLETPKAVGKKEPIDYWKQLWSVFKQGGFIHLPVF